MMKWTRLDEFIAAANEVFPGVCFHFEDWKGTDAVRLFDRYKAKHLIYNDDIQGTASVALAGLMTALKIKRAALKDQRVFFLGAGSAGVGIANMLVAAMVDEGLSITEARQRVSLFDINGLIEPSRTDLSPSQKVYVHPHSTPTKSLLQAITEFRPSILIGVSTTGGAFTQAVVEKMAELNERPIIFPLSNPTDRAECTPEQAYGWTKGKAIYAAGVQFPDVTINGKTYYPSQANNFYIFPAIALAVYATRPNRITDRMFIDAAKAMADQVAAADRDIGMLYPKQADILATEIATAAGVAEAIFDRREATVERPHDIRAWIEAMTFKPAYDEA